MRLVRIRIEGYRSIREPLDVVLDPKVTVLLGANDHGKTNFLEAVAHLNLDNDFEEEDLNWDRAGQTADYPAITYTLQLSETERAQLSRLDAAHRLADASAAAVQDADEQLAALAEERDAILAAGRESAAQVEELAAEAQEAVNARKEDSDSGTAKVVATEAEQRLRAARTEGERVEGQAAELAAKAEKIALARAIAQGRSYQATALSDAEEVPVDLVSTLAADAEAAAEAARKRLARAATQSKTARDALEALTEDVEAAALEKAERDAKTAEAEEASERKVAQELARRAEELRRSADGLEALAAGEIEASAFDLDPAGLTKRREVPEVIEVNRTGLAGEVQPEVPDGVEAEALERFIGEGLPRVEVLEPLDQLPDDVSATQLEGGQNPFMRGIFLYAGIDPAEWDGIFSQDPRTSMRLEQASDQLNETLRASWSQGRELIFRLKHDSKRSRINLEIKDPAVKSTFTRPSRRSSGFTHFFALKTILHALQAESPHSSYLWIFDEPGIHLHPDGQRDLIQVMETLGATNQVIYTTHSIFLANQNYPARHRLLVRSAGGTKIDTKPFVGRWRTALDALGVSLAGSVLFAPHVVLVEGDSDAIFLTALLRKLIALGHLDIDLNRFAAMATGDAANARVLIRFLTEVGNGAGAPRLALLVDGDGGGKRRLAALADLTADLDIPTKELRPANTTTEDHLLGARTLYPEAVGRYLGGLKDLDPAKLEEIQTSFETKFPEGSEAVVGLAAWAKEDAAAIAGLDEKPSSVGIARSYAELLEAAELGAKDLVRGRKLAEWIRDVLEVPPSTLRQEQIVDSTED
jgi:predicted ATP-dependent endonuclease of OLD family